MNTIRSMDLLLTK